MTAKFEPSVLRGTLEAPPSKSMAHRYLICSALSGESCTLSGVDFSEDILENFLL
jgi:3-phosphoshikimate 1-carboxyvinyltransferase